MRETTGPGNIFYVRSGRPKNIFSANETGPDIFLLVRSRPGKFLSHRLPDRLVLPSGPGWAGQPAGAENTSGVTSEKMIDRDRLVAVSCPRSPNGAQFEEDIMRLEPHRMRFKGILIDPRSFSLPLLFMGKLAQILKNA